MATYFTSNDSTRSIEAPTSAKYVLVNRETDEIVASGQSRGGLQKVMEMLRLTSETVRIAATYNDDPAPVRTGPSQADMIRLAIARQNLNGRRR